MEKPNSSPLRLLIWAALLLDSSVNILLLPLSLQGETESPQNLLQLHRFRKRAKLIIPQHLDYLSISSCRQGIAQWNWIHLAKFDTQKSQV